MPTEDLGVRVTAEKALKPARLASFRIELTGPVLEERHQAGILRAMKACLIHNTLLGEPSIEIVVNAAGCAQVQPQASLAARESGLGLIG